MSYTLSLNHQVKQQINLKQNQLLMMLPKMQQAIQILQLPVMELSAFIEEEIEKNPILENNTTSEDEHEPLIDEMLEKEPLFGDQDIAIIQHLEEDFVERSHLYRKNPETENLRTSLENSIASPKTLFSHLMLQARDSFNSEDLKLAEIIIGNIDDRGYLTTSLDEISAMTSTKKEHLIKLLEEIQTFEPYGIGAENIQKSLLIQLRSLGKEKSLAYTILEKHYEDLLHNHFPKIQKKLGCSYEEIRAAIDNHIAKLEINPGASFSSNLASPIIPDIMIHLHLEGLIIEVNEDHIPEIKVNHHYLQMLKSPTATSETKDFIQQHLLSAGWLSKSIKQRNETITRIVHHITTHQKDFFLSNEGKLLPLTMKEIAQALGLHESTIARAVANKYVGTPRGLLALRSFFTTAYTTTDGTDISSKTVQQAIDQIIQQEDKKNPLSDETITAKLLEQGIVCARRTVAKHRHALKLANRHQRRRF